MQNKLYNTDAAMSQTQHFEQAMTARSPAAVA